jgi:hypothetical protein
MPPPLRSCWLVLTLCALATGPRATLGQTAAPGVPVGTQPGFTGSPYDANSFPISQVLTVLPQDAIPAVTDPELVSPEQVRYVSGGDLVFGVVIDGDARAYPHSIGWWHEIVNDVVGGRPVCVTFCPLTGTGLVFDGRDGNGGRRLLGVSGRIYNTNLVMYDPNDPGSLYPQIYAAAVRGTQAGRTLPLMPVVETKLSSWRRLYPDTRVVAPGPYPETQYYGYPYGEYRTDDDVFLFDLQPSPASNPNAHALRFGSKDRILGVRIDAETVAFPYAQMAPRRVINEIVGGVEIVVAFDDEAYLAIPYWRRVAGRVLSFDVLDDGSFPFALQDRETGTRWDIRGRAVEGPLAGEQLVQVPAHSAMWFAWVTFWPATRVWMAS